MKTDINRLKVVLAEKKRTNKWLCEQLNVNPSTVSKWCTNSSQPDLETLIKISYLLDVELDDLVNKNLSAYSIDTEFQQITEVCIKYASKSETAQNSLIYYAI